MDSLISRRGTIDAVMAYYDEEYALTDFGTETH